MINAYLAAINGAPIEAHLGRTVIEMLPELSSDLEPLLRQVLATGEPVLNKVISGLTGATCGLAGQISGDAFRRYRLWWQEKNAV